MCSVSRERNAASLQSLQFLQYLRQFLHGKSSEMRAGTSLSPPVFPCTDGRGGRSGRYRGRSAYSAVLQRRIGPGRLRSTWTPRSCAIAAPFLRCCCRNPCRRCSIPAPFLLHSCSNPCLPHLQDGWHPCAPCLSRLSRANNSPVASSGIQRHPLASHRGLATGTSGFSVRSPVSPSV